ncbi:ParB/RepB/Spo0J family partition protein [Anaerococcus urinomassiliensis]|uniref:ParB/RepB/Spo0J family partition protein n=1 Tax=Anaerococcus urinomassiliensis TaxID=1745712 RepID=UPI000939AD2D|nr:ParB/RepB/Spo0J family partition protein [Anaerococcus urinomassiliensis]
MSNRRALGRGLNSLIPENSNKELKPVFNYNKKNDENVNKTYDSKVESIRKISLDKIKAREGQPRKTFDDDSLNELADSIKEYGLLNPIVVTKKDDHYEILAGERRYRASKLAGLDKIDAIIKEFEQKDVDVLSLIENIQREDLKALEEAQAYQKLSRDHKMTQEQIAKTVGKSRSYIANTLRLLNLYDIEKRALNDGKISPSQARTLLSIADPNERSLSLNDFINGSTNIRKVERKISTKTEKKESTPNIDDILFEDLEEKFMDKLGSKVNVKKSGKAYKVTIDCYSIEDVEKIYDKLTN